MLSAEQKKIGYICVPYTNDENSLKLKNDWTYSRNIKSIYFVTATFSEDIKSYFPSSTNHYMLAKFENHQKLIKDVKKFTNSSPSFVFSVDDELFERDVNIEQKFISMYYITYNDHETISTIANVIAKKEKIRQAGFAHMDLFCHDKPKFTFPYTKIIVLEVSDERSPQSIFKYCEKTRQDIARKGVLMNNFVNLSLLDKLK